MDARVHRELGAVRHAVSISNEVDAEISSNKETLFAFEYVVSMVDGSDTYVRLNLLEEIGQRYVSIQLDMKDVAQIAKEAKRMLTASRAINRIAKTGK